MQETNRDYYGKASINSGVHPLGSTDIVTKISTRGLGMFLKSLHPCKFKAFDIGKNEITVYAVKVFVRKDFPMLISITGISVRPRSVVWEMLLRF